MTEPSADPKIEEEYYFTAGGGTWAARETIQRDHVQTLNRLVFCTLVLSDGRLVTGEHHAGPENFDERHGRVMARKQAFEKLARLELCVRA